MIKKIPAILIALTIAVSAASCSNGSQSSADTKTTAAETTTAETAAEAPATTFTDEMKSKLDAVIKENECEGTAYITQFGEKVYQYSGGEDVNGDKITIDTPLPVGSVSKQFCAAVIMKLCEEGKLSTDDTLDKFFPDYKEGKKLTLHNLLSMRSGISDIVNHGNLNEVNLTGNYDDNRKLVRDEIFKQSLTFKPDSAYEYSNSNYILLSAVAEAVTGEKYCGLLRKYIFEPLNMTGTGSTDEYVNGVPKWSGKLDYTDIPGVATGAGDIVSTGPDMDKWLTGLKSGKVVSEESYKKMITEYSEDNGSSYGYGFILNYKGGIGHDGAIMIKNIPYCAYDYTGTGNGYNIILECSDCNTGDLEALRNDILNAVTGE